jgi:hypothetical protein
MRLQARGPPAHMSLRGLALVYASKRGASNGLIRKTIGGLHADQHVALYLHDSTSTPRGGILVA